MKTVQQWYSEYAESHQNKLNQSIHYICVPLIFFSIIGLFMSIPNTFLAELSGFDSLLFVNWAIIGLIVPMIFYTSLSFRVFLRMVIFSAICIAGNYFMSFVVDLLIASIAIFVLAWIGQFYGHHVEGKKPSFLKDLQFLLIGPAWVFEKMVKK
ncbi:MAG: DUF962 domain-containing protein [Crocinitomicaceae bacterium]|nr:DUF962 domain-containing protein [Crocinitomicaceae bacterium]